ncbi:MAG: Bax protein [Thermosipho sp. (in: thermotogales)]|nr:Bax protein [Thermosipho sp. (in: thermotogales)]MDN5324490.1 Bax protein [Thermosipho sp. (in: thermotogales)]
MKKIFIGLIIGLVLVVIFDFYTTKNLFSLDLNITNIVPQEITVEFDSWKQLKDYFDEIGYNSLENVPNIIVKRFPKDLNEAPVNIKKELFVKVMTPIVRKVNNEILNERNEILMAIKNNDIDVLNYYMKKYYSDNIDDLLLKVDVIPEDLAIAQAAVESAWGSSRFAIEANNIFGEWTFVPGTGIVPKNRPAGATYEIEVFDSLLDSMRSYALNLNKLPFYEDFRLIRAGLKKGHPADGLLSYSELGNEYIEMVKVVIKHLPKL